MIATPTPPPPTIAEGSEARKPRAKLRVRAAAWIWRCVSGFLILWLACQLLTDRFHWSQYIFWLVPEAALVVGAALWGFAKLLRGRATPGAGRRPGSTSSRLALALLCAVLGVTAFDWHAWRYATPVKATGAATLRVLHWNPSDPSLKGLADLVLAESPDIAFITDPPWGVNWNALRDRMGGAEGPMTAAEDARANEPPQGADADAKSRADRESRPTASAIRFGYLAQLVVFSRYPVIRWGGTQLDIKGVNDRFFGIGPITHGPIYPGVALFAELDTTAVLGRPIVVWFVDMPSDVRVWRRGMMEDAARTLAGDNAVCSVRGSRGQDIAEPGKKPFPPPDLIVGDFNTPRGSESLRRLVGDMEEAYDQAGRGGCRTYPRWLPMTPIDHVFLAPWLHAQAYRVENPGMGRHRYQVCEVGKR